MGDYVFLMKLDTNDSRTPQIRVWIDDPLAGDLASEREVALVREAEDSWGARFSTEGDAFTYRIGICATPGTTWTLSFRSADDGDELLFDSDRLTVAKEWLLGTCELSDGGAATHLSLAGASSAAS